MADSTGNVLYYGDNLDVLRRHVADESVDLIYLDPPFNSNASYSVLFGHADGTNPPRRSRRSMTHGTGTAPQRQPLRRQLQGRGQ